MAIRAIRGAITVSQNSETEILAATQELLEAIRKANPTMDVEELVSAWFTATGDLDAVYPAKAARQMGWTGLAMLCAQEMQVRGSLKFCIRVLLHWNTELPVSALKHVYLREAGSLRPDWAGPEESIINNRGVL
jgi:chorismate mutase